MVIIKNCDGINVVSSRIVAKELEKEHSDVMRKIREVLGVGEFSESTYINTQNKEQPELLLTKDGFTLLCMNYQGYNDFKRAYINKFNEMEKELTYKLPTNFKEALIELVKAEEEKERLMLDNNKLDKKVKLLTHVNKLYTSTEIAKELGYKSATQFNEVLKNMSVQYKVNNTWVLSAKYSNLGYESIKQNVLDNGKVVYDRKFTQEGRDFIIDLFN